MLYVINKPAEKCAKIERNRRGAVGKLQNPALAERFQEKRRLQAVGRAIRRVRFVPPKLLRLRVFKARAWTITKFAQIQTAIFM